MGLDQYLSKKIYIGANFEHRGITGKISIKQGNTIIPIDFKKVKEVIEEAGYWRKANAIHKWFVDNVQDGQDDCSSYRVTKEQFLHLLADVEFALDNKDKASRVLPPESGFFFGSVDYDEWYWEDLKYTRKLIKGILKDYEKDEANKIWATYEYQSSW